LSIVYDAGYGAGVSAYLNPADLGANLASMLLDVGQYGTYDYQRTQLDGTYAPNQAYRDVSNFNVGLWGYGDGLSETGTLNFASFYGFFKSNNFFSSTRWAQTSSRIATGHLYCWQYGPPVPSPLLRWGGAKDMGVDIKWPSPTRHAAIVMGCWVAAYPIAGFLTEFFHDMIAVILHPTLFFMMAIELAFVDSVLHAIDTMKTLGFPYGDILDEQNSNMGGTYLPYAVPRINMYPYIVLVAIFLYSLIFLFGFHQPRSDADD
jgi:hypothetical protein